MNAYSKDLTLKVLAAAIDRAIPSRREVVADLFGISLSSIKRWGSIGDNNRPGSSKDLADSWQRPSLKEALL
jgi:hypothetical protein